MDLNVQSLKESNKFLNDVYDNITSAIFIANGEPRIYHFNNAFKALFYKPEDQLLMSMCGNAVGCIFQVEESKECGTTSRCGECSLRSNIVRTLGEKVPVYKEKLAREFVIDNSVITKYFSFTTKPVVYHDQEMVLVIMDDITDHEEQKMFIERHNRNLENTIREKITNLMQLGADYSAELHNNNELLKEIHHRVGNNLQIVLSLLRLQMQHAENEIIAEHFQDTEKRIMTIRLLYNHLIQVGPVSTINMKNYLGSLIMQIRRMNASHNSDLSVEFSCDDIYFNIDTAMPLGLIAYELVSNSIKHAFPGGGKGTIKLILSDHGNDSFLFFISDDGIWRGDVAKKEKGLGITLVHVLAEQLAARISWSMQNGTSYTFQFKIKKSNVA